MGNFEGKMPKELKRAHYHRFFDMGNYSHLMPKMLKRAHYHQWGLAKQDENVGMPVPGKTIYGLRDTVKLLGHEDLDVIDIFKIDCELCEWDTYMDWLADGIPLLHQIQVETHGVPGEKALGFFDTFEAAGYLRYHKEANILLAEQFRKFGQCLEYGMVKVRPPATYFFHAHGFVLSSSMSILSLHQGFYGIHEWKGIHFQQREIQNGPRTNCKVLTRYYRGGCCYAEKSSDEMY
jgi:hypothetical protein